VVTSVAVPFRILLSSYVALGVVVVIGKGRHTTSSAFNFILLLPNFERNVHQINLHLILLLRFTPKVLSPS